MNYQEALDFLLNATPVFQKIGASAYKEGLDNTLLLDDYFHHPHLKYKTIHVAGTNGKGSVSHTLAAIFQSAGYKTGLYTSPHLLDFRERIRVNGVMIDKKFVAQFVTENFLLFQRVKPSFFELTMMMAFCYFEKQQVDVAIIEVGLGGRLDSTNIICPELSIITNIGFDHMQFLGNTLEKIAKEKAGIIKPHIPVVIGESGTDEVKNVFLCKAEECEAPIFLAEESGLLLSSEKISDGWRYETSLYPHLEGALGGYAQKKNTATLLMAIEQLKKLNFTLPDEAVYNGFKEVVTLTGLQGRWQILRKQPKVVCDTGHNSSGIQYVVEQLRQEQYEQLHIVIGMVSDKDINAVLKLLPQQAVYYFTKASIPRALNEKRLQEEASFHGLQGNSYVTVPEAVSAAMQACREKDFLYIGGSNFIVAEALPCF